MADTAAAAPTVPFFKKKSKQGGNTATKKRAASPSATTATAGADSNDSHNHSANGIGRSYNDDDDRGEGPSVIRMTKKEAFNPLKQGTSKTKRRRGNDGRILRDDEPSDDDEDDLDLEDSSKPFVHYKDRRVSEKIKEQDQEEILSGEAALSKTGEKSDAQMADDGLYKGKASYMSQLPTGSQKYAPIKGPSSDIRTITLMDYQPDRCKDYAETGWCGFGDSCKFLHDRSDYKHGWEMDNSFLSNQPKSRAEDIVEEEELPFACLICREPFGDPKSPHAAVVTRCGHYFGGSCAIKRFSKNPKCFACGAGTQGIFNKADKILERMEKLQQARLKKGKDEEGHDYDDENEGGVEIEGLAEE